MKRSDLFYTALMVPLDYIAVVASFFLAHWLRTNYPTLIPSFLLGGFADNLQYTPELELLPYNEYVTFVLSISILIILIFFTQMAAHLIITEQV